MGKHWVDGKYAFKGTPWFCNEVKGEVAYWRNLSEFDHPELDARMEGIIFCPNFNYTFWTFCSFQELGNMENFMKQ